MIQSAPQDPNATWNGEYRVRQVQPLKAFRELFVLELEDCSGSREVRYRARLDEAGEPELPTVNDVVHVHITHTQASGGGWYDRVDRLEKTTPTSALRLLPPRICPEPEALRRLHEVLETEIRSEPLQRFVDRVFEDEETARAFATVPASYDCHHTEAGGLLVHSLNVLEYLRQMPMQCDLFQRECVLIAALFHDIGKVAPRVQRHKSPYWNREHALLNKLMLEDALSGLRHQDPEAWSNLHFLFDFLAGTVSGNRILESQLIIDFDRYDAGTDTRERAIATANPGDSIVVKQPSNGGSKRVFFLPSHAWKSEEQTKLAAG
ncbi:HD domain-containing protein [Thiohalospira halophila]|uniref:HD domain-containing protein n=1 Tax=Thiohalospira halophila TaxID=381300 RepID=UPI0013565BCB|nr:HD domain-containing protein [Thiohalospira halophila]